MINDVAPLPGYPETYGLLCAILQDGTNEWRGELEQGLGPDSMTWRIRQGGQTIGALMMHIIGVELFWFEQFVLGREPSVEDRKLLLVDEIDVDRGIWPDPPPEPMSWYIDLQDRFRARSLEGIKRWPAPEHLKDLHGRSRSARWVLGHVIQHESYHGGQIVLQHDLWKHK